jgi:pimeloyl-ACP methyl ester carboxylesterase
VIKFSTRRFGYGTLWYQKFFVEPDAAQIVDSHLESMWTMMNGEPETWLQTMAVEDGVRNFLLQDKRQPVMAYGTEERRQRWLQHISRGGMTGPLNYYRASVSGTQAKAEAMVPPENRVVRVPHLFFGGRRDFVCRPELCDDAVKAGWLPDCTKVVVDSGHWAHLDKPKEFGEALLGWLRAKFPKSRL